MQIQKENYQAVVYKVLIRLMATEDLMQSQRVYKLLQQWLRKEDITPEQENMLLNKILMEEMNEKINHIREDSDGTSSNR